MNETASLEIYLPYVFLAVYYVVMFRLWLQPPPTDPLADGTERDFTPASPAVRRAGLRSLPEAKSHASLAAIQALDAGFEEDAFLQGASQAYEMILGAYAEGNRPILESLLEIGPLSVFSASIMQRQHKHRTLVLCLVGVNDARIVNCTVDGDIAEITVRFVSDMISSTHSRDGRVIDGDPEKIVRMADRWTFRRDIRSSDPNWKLCATRPDAGDASRQARTPIPL